MKARLLCRLRPGAPQAFALGQGEAVLGREPGLAVSLPLDGISRRHARITWDGQLHWLEDLRSTNGTFLNGQPIRRERLRHLDVITLGRRVDLVFVLKSDDAASVMRLGVVRAALVEAEGDERHEVPTGELTLGRSTACNVVVASGVVSSLHARILRAPEQLVIEDLGSANGTFVNGARVQTSELHQGDLISLAGAASFKVDLELGDVLTASAARPRGDLLGSLSRPRQQFSAEWKTRFEWSSGEHQMLEALKAGAAPPPEDLVPGTLMQPAVAPTVPRAASAPPAAARPAPARPVAATPPKAAPPPAPGRPAAKPPQPVPERQAAAPSPAPQVAPPASTPPAGLKAVVLSSSLGELRVSEPGAHVLGRGTDAALRLQHPTVSRRHARLILADDRSVAYVQDAGGANGTFLNGVQVTQLAALAQGDKVRVGEIELVVALER